MVNLKHKNGNLKLRERKGKKKKNPTSSPNGQLSKSARITKPEESLYLAIV